ncbi:Nif3-like dinuclear metal center hexameric protein [Thermococcus sp. SY098]|uniref:Nif3-like dinuclear metal center hexameric protein n=1 Tax=Thermococcus sp. SY098 TaxID=3111325 RepID=UPI002D7900A5|nr:Nif3-like dinuclear metal center hexameric protein [Thermococcus sp. SY098]WRS51790.1 Nif3-like dinuclear metal center hexameric protein [Thermococcus sp. SY098]
MASRDEIVSFLDEYLNIKAFPDKSKNGLQVEGKGEVNTIAFAVDACLDTFVKAKAFKADMVIVHHGIVWGGVEYVTGLIQKRLKFLLENDINLYVAHVPLDAHPEVGNNAQILKLLDLEPKEPFGDYGGVTIGFIGEFEEPKPLPLIAQILVEKLKIDYVKSYEFGKQEIKRVGVISGAGGFAIEEAVKKNVDLFITGEFTHGSYRTAEDLRLSVLAAGHYATETLGVKALMPLLREKFSVKTVFIDNPTGL